MSAEVKFTESQFSIELQRIREEAEKNPLPITDCLVNIGHTIIRRGGGGWMPSKAAQKVNTIGYWPDGGKKYIRTAEYVRNSRQLYSQEDAIVGGGIVAVQAAVEFYKSLKQEGRVPKIVVYCGGRAKYLEDTVPEEPNICEAVLMREMFEKSLADIFDPAETGVVMKTENRTTQDDMMGALAAAEENNCSSLTIVALELRLPRCAAFVRNLQENDPDIRKVQVNYMPAEVVMRQVAELRDRSSQWNNFNNELVRSKPYERTLLDETIAYTKAIERNYTAKGET